MSRQDDIEALKRFEPLRGVHYFTFPVYASDTIEDVINRAAISICEDAAMLLDQFEVLLEDAGFPHKKPWYKRLFSK